MRAVVSAARPPSPLLFVVLAATLVAIARPSASVHVRGTPGLAVTRRLHDAAEDGGATEDGGASAGPRGVIFGGGTAPPRRPPERALDGPPPDGGRRGQEAEPPPAPATTELSVTLIAAIAGGGAAFVLAFGLVVYICHRHCRRREKPPPLTAGFGTGDKVASGTTAATDRNARSGGLGAGDGRGGPFPVPVVVDVGDFDGGGGGHHSLDDTTLEGRSVGNREKKRSGGTTPSTSASSRTPTPRGGGGGGGNSPYGYLESPPRAIMGGDGGGNGRSGGSGGGGGGRGTSRAYVDVEKRSVGSSDDGSQSFVSPFQVVGRSGVALGEEKGVGGSGGGFDDAGSKFGAPGGFEIDYEDGLIFPAEAAGQRPMVEAQVQNVRAPPAHGSFAPAADPWGGGGGFAVDAKDEKENVRARPNRDSAAAAWDARRYPSKSSESGDRNFFRNEMISSADFRDNIELDMDEFASVPAPAPARPHPATNGGRRTRREASDPSLDSSAGGGGRGPGSRPGSEASGASSSLASRRLRQTSPFLAKYLEETRAAAPDLANVPDPEDSFLDEHDSSSDDEGAGPPAAAAPVRAPSPAAPPPSFSTPSPVPRRGESSRSSVRRPRASSPSPSAVSATPSSSSSGGVKREGDYGPDLRTLRGASGGPSPPSVASPEAAGGDRLRSSAAPHASQGYDDEENGGRGGHGQSGGATMTTRETPSDEGDANRQRGAPTDDNGDGGPPDHGHGPFPEVAMRSEAGVSSLGQRSAAGSARRQSDVDLRAVMTSAAAATSIADAAGARRRAQQRQRRTGAAAASSSSPHDHERGAYGTDVSNLTSDDGGATSAPPSGNERDSSSDGDGEDGDDNDFLFDAVEGTLGPRGMSADMESLGGASHRSGSGRSGMGGGVGRPRSTRNVNRSSDRSLGSRTGAAAASSRPRSGRSDRSVGSRNASRRNLVGGPPGSSGASVGSRRRRQDGGGARRPRGSGGASVGSRGSRASRTSRASRAQSTAGGVGGAGGGTGSVSAALQRLEGHFEALDKGASLGGDGGGSVISGRSRASRTPSAASSSRRGGRPVSAASSAAVPPSERMRVDVAAPPGKLGIILQNRSQNRGGTVVSDVRSSSLLHGKVFPGDRIVAIDDEDASLLTVAEITAVMARKADLHRTLAVITTRRRPGSSDGGEGQSFAPGAGSSYNRSYR